MNESFEAVVAGLNNADTARLIDLNVHGYALYPRDPAVKPEFPGVWMVVDTLDDNGFSIVGDDPGELIRVAHAFLEFELDRTGH